MDAVMNGPLGGLIALFVGMSILIGVICLVHSIPDIVDFLLGDD